MYDIEKRRLDANITVGDFCKYLLENVPVDVVFHVGGMDHIIVGSMGYTSFHEKGLL